jgi:hypothetical protein
VGAVIYSVHCGCRTFEDYKNEKAIPFICRLREFQQSAEELNEFQQSAEELNDFDGSDNGKDEVSRRIE